MMLKGGRPPPPSPSHPLTRTLALLTSAPAAVLLFFLGFALGYFSGFPSSPSPPQPPLARLPPLPHSESFAAESSTDPSPPPPPPPPPLPPPPHDLLRFRTNCSPPIPQSEIRQTLINRLFDGKSPYDEFPSPATAEFLLPPPGRLRGWGSTNSVFGDLISAVRPLTIIELGTFLGASALHMAALTRNHSLPDTLILCLDDFRGWPGFRSDRLRRDVPPPHHADSLLLHQFMLSVSAAAETGRVLPVPFSTASALAALCEWGIYGDLIEVDAGHDFHSAWADINMAWAVLRPGGILFGHDYHTMADDRGVRRAVTLFARVNGLGVRAHGQHWVLTPKPT